MSSAGDLAPPGTEFHAINLGAERRCMTDICDFARYQQPQVRLTFVETELDAGGTRVDDEDRLRHLTLPS